VSDFLERVRKNAESVGGVGYWSWNLETGDIFWSEECYKIYGRDAMSWTPTIDNYQDHIHDDDREGIIASGHQKIERQEPYFMEYRYYKGGSRDDVLWVRTDCDFITNDDGELCIVGVSRDISEQKSTEFELQQSRNRFETFADAASDWFWEMDASLRFTYVSPRAVEILGVPVSFLIGKTRREISGEMIDNEKWQRHYEELDAHRAFRDFKFVRKGHDGRLQYIATSGIPKFDEEGNFTGYAGASSSLAGRLDEEEKANLVREQLAAAVNALSELFVLWDPQDRLVICNDQFRKINEAVSETTEPGTLFRDHVRAVLEHGAYPASKGREEEWYADRIAQHENPGQPFEVDRQGGRCLLVHEQKIPDGSTITISSDITERKRHEEDLRIAKQNAEFANRAKTEFLAHMSHELRTPLNAIIGFSQICESELFGKQSNPKYVEYATDIRTASTHLLDLISDVLDISKLEEGEYKIEEAVFSIEKALEACLTMVTGRASSKQIKINVSVDPGINRLKADERLVKQIVLNLLSNAIKFTPAGGRVSVRASLAEDEGLNISVIDNGNGIAEDDIAKILEPYVQVRDNPGVAHEGTGLGLPIVKGLTELHGGQLFIDSEIGHGTKITVRMPKERVVSSD